MQAATRQPQKFDFPAIDQPAALLFLASMQELREKKMIYTGSVVSLLWHALFVLKELAAHPGGDAPVLRTADGKYWLLTNQPKLSDVTVRWLASVHPQDFLYTLLCSVDAGAQARITQGWRDNPDEKPQIVAGLRKFQDEFKSLLHTLVSRGLLKFPPTLLKNAG